MKGLEYILDLYRMPHMELAEKLGIRKQNVNMWLKGKQNIPKKHLPKLSEIFKLKEEYFSKELTELDYLEIQKEKLKKELEPVIDKWEEEYNFKEATIEKKPIYNRDEINEIEKSIERVKLIEKFSDLIKDTPYLENYKLIVHLLENSQQEVLLKKTLEALTHYFEIVNGDTASSPEQFEFEEEIFEVFDDNNY